jgi:voltage-gated potassium channel
MLTTASLLIIHLEFESPETQFETSGDAIWWSFVTVTTVGYGDYIPTTQGGRFVAVGVMTVGVAMVSVLTSYITSALFLRKDPEQEKKLIHLQEEFETVNEKLDKIMIWMDRNE